MTLKSQLAVSSAASIYILTYVRYFACPCLRSYSCLPVVAQSFDDSPLMPGIAYYLIKDVQYSSCHILMIKEDYR